MQIQIKQDYRVDGGEHCWLKTKQRRRTKRCYSQQQTVHKGTNNLLALCCSLVNFIALPLFEFYNDGKLKYKRILQRNIWR